MKRKTTKTLTLLTTFLTCLLMLSTATALPVATSEPVMDLVEEQEQLMELSTTIEDIINSDCSLVEKKESLLQHINDFDISPLSGDLPIGLLLYLLVAPFGYFLMYSNPTFWIPFTVIGSIFFSVLTTIDILSRVPPSDPSEYILNFIVNFLFCFFFNIIFGPIWILVLVFLYRLQRQTPPGLETDTESLGKRLHLHQPQQ